MSMLLVSLIHRGWHRSVVIYILDIHDFIFRAKHYEVFSDANNLRQSFWGARKTQHWPCFARHSVRRQPLRGWGHSRTLHLYLVFMYLYLFIFVHNIVSVRHRSPWLLVGYFIGSQTVMLKFATRFSRWSCVLAWSLAWRRVRWDVGIRDSWASSPHCTIFIRLTYSEMFKIKIEFIHGFWLITRGEGKEGEPQIPRQ